VSAAVIAGLIDMYMMLVLKEWASKFSSESFIKGNLKWASSWTLLRYLIGESTISFMKTRTLLFPLFELVFSVLIIVNLYSHGIGGAFVQSTIFMVIALPIAMMSWQDPNGHGVLTIIPLSGTAMGLLTSLLPGSIGWINAVLGAVVGGFIFITLFVVARIVFPNTSVPFGLGNVYVAIMLGSFCGITRLMPSVFYGMILSGTYSFLLIALGRLGRNVPRYIPYPPFIVIGGIIGMLF
jgi:leader peptidase (prepilin peptidase)/N-methyltransferase